MPALTRSSASTMGWAVWCPRSERKVPVSNQATSHSGRVAGAHREEEVGAPPVGARREVVVVGTGHVVHHLGAEPFQALPQRRADLVEAERHREVDASTRDADRPAELVSLAHRGDGSRGHALDATERLEGCRSGHAVDGEARVALELAQCRRGLGSEDAVFAAGVEPESVEGVLQRRDVVAAEVG